jgi:hypothetical protein
MLRWLRLSFHQPHRQSKRRHNPRSRGQLEIARGSIGERLAGEKFIAVSIVTMFKHADVSSELGEKAAGSKPG